MSIPEFELIRTRYMRTIASTMLFGGILIGLGIAKIIIDKKKIVLPKFF